MQNMRRRLTMLERLPRIAPPPSPLEQIRSLALQSLSAQDLAILQTISVEHAAGLGPAELSQVQAGACEAWAAALEAEARRMGFRSYAAVERTAGPKR